MLVLGRKVIHSLILVIGWRYPKFILIALMIICLIVIAMTILLKPYAFANII